MGIFHRRLRDYLGREILVVMSDSRAFKGTLSEFDETALVLRDVLESSTQDIRWRVPLVPLPGKEAEASDLGQDELALSGGSKGMGRLKEVVVATDKVLRVWLWVPEEHRGRDFERIAHEKA